MEAGGNQIERGSRAITHVLLTRFNLATPGRESRLRLKPDWLGHRFDLFERHCLPCVAEQETPPDRWLIFFDKATPQPFRDRIERCRGTVPFTPVFCDPTEDADWKQTIFGALHDGVEEWLLTTRLDNDDGLARDFCRRLRDAARTELDRRAGQGPGRVVLNFTAGVVLAGDRLYLHHHPSNAFASLLEPWASALTIVHWPHMVLSSHAPVEQIAGPPGWLQVVHDRNVSNRVRGWRIDASEIAELFPDTALGSPRSVTASARWVENVVFGIPRRALDLGVAGLRILRRRGFRPVPRER